MALVLKLCYQFFYSFDTDPRTENMFLVRSPLPTLAISAGYLAFIWKIGPSLMKNRPAYDLKYVIMIYNLFQVLANLSLIYMATHLFLTNKKISELTCLQADWSNSPYALDVLRLSYFYYLLKIIDFIDTIFFVLRKRQSQITFLHVYHHFGITVSAFVALKYIGGGQVAILGYLNTYVHAVMYFYYFMSALRPAMKNSLWWKKYITQMQITQFVLNMVHFSIALFNKDCNQSKVLMAYCVIQNLFITILFVDFYVKAYIRKPKRNKAT